VKSYILPLGKGEWDRQNLKGYGPDGEPAA
jgi:hypothetical protein